MGNGGTPENYGLTENHASPSFSSSLSLSLSLYLSLSISFPFLSVRIRVLLTLAALVVDSCAKRRGISRITPACFVFASEIIKL